MAAIQSPGIAIISRHWESRHTVLFLPKFDSMKYLWLGLMLFVMSCSSDTNSESDALSVLESAVAETPTNANVDELVGIYEEWLNENQANTPERKEVLLKLYAVSTQHLRHTSKLNTLRELILQYPDDSETLDRKRDLGDTYDRIRREAAAQVVYVNLIAQNPDNNAMITELKGKLPDPTPNQDIVISQLGSQMFGDGSMRINTAVARAYIDACQAYAIVNDGDSTSAENLHKAAETARSLGQMDQALMFYDWIMERYQDHPRTPQALFLKAFTYDSDLKEFDQAKVYYTEFIKKYPDNDFAQSAEFLLENLGKDDEELLEILQKKAEAEGEGQ